jgi:hypothetical protein
MGSESRKKASASQKPQDVVLVYGRHEDGKGYEVLRQRGDAIQAATMRPLDEGKPIHGEVVRLQPREDSPVLFDVQVEHTPRISKGRPPKVATEQYRKGWESIWERKRDNRAIN